MTLGVGLLLAYLATLQALVAADEQCDIQVWTHFAAALLGSSEISCNNAPDYQGGCVATMGVIPPEYLTQVLAASDGGGIGSTATTAEGYCADLCRVGCFSPIAALPMWFASPCSPAVEAMPGLISLRVYCGFPWGLGLLVLVCVGACGGIVLQRRTMHGKAATDQNALLEVEMRQLQDSVS